MTSTFDKAFEYSVSNEGGYSDDPDDSGGPTNYGVSQAFLDQHLHDPICCVVAKDLTLEMAKTIYLKYFWKLIHLEQLTDPILAIKVFDFGVNAGPNRSILLLQRAFNDIYPSKEIKEDGIMGMKTVGAVNDGDATKILNAFINQMIRFYKKVVTTKPVTIKYLNGWTARARRMP